MMRAQRPIYSTVKRVSERELRGRNRGFENDWMEEVSIIDRMGLSNTFRGHEGCVNTLKWNKAGSLIASGSDDRTVRIWTLDGEQVTLINTGHRQNVFAVEFLPCRGDNILVSAAGDAKIILHNLELGDDANVVWKAEGRVKRLASSYDEPHLIWSAAEDGCIRQHDARTNESPVIIQNERGYKAMAVAENKSELIAAGSMDSAVPIYDRRHIAKPLVELIPADLTVDNRGMFYPTHIAFDKTGTEVVVNLGGASIFVYDLLKAKHPTTLEQLNKCVADQWGEIVPLQPSLTFTEPRETARALFADGKYSKAIDIYNKALILNSSNIDKSILLANRGAARLARHWEGDFYECVKDCIESLNQCPGNSKSLYRLIKALSLSEQWEVAKKAINLFKDRFPNDTSIKTMETEVLAKVNVDCSFWKLEENMIDYSERYVGHWNLQTDIKEANFFGGRDGYIVAGSDDGSMMIWERKTGVLKAGFVADSDILNICQPHPTLPLIASSGIEDVIRIWEPLPEDQKCERRHTDPWENCGRLNSNSMSDILFLRGNRLNNRNSGPTECITS